MFQCFTDIFFEVETAFFTKKSLNKRRDFPQFLHEMNQPRLLLPLSLINCASFAYSTIIFTIQPSVRQESMSNVVVIICSELSNYAPAIRVTVGSENVCTSVPTTLRSVGKL